MADPAAARLTAGMREALLAAAARWPVAIVTGRDLTSVRALLGIDSLTIAASHGFDVWSPDRGRLPGPPVDENLLRRVAAQVTAGTASLPGVEVETKSFSVALHERRAGEAEAAAVRRLVDRIVDEAGGALRVTPGRHVFEIQPSVAWDKGRAVSLLLEDLGDVFPIYLGDDVTDEDGFRAVAARGAGILVRSEERGDRPTAATLSLGGVDDVERFLREIAQY